MDTAKTMGKTYHLNAEGPGGKDTYELIYSVLGRNAIEHPDDDHTPPMRHIHQAVDDVVGPHFVFLAHRDIDTDRQKNFDRSRIEIKVAPSSGPWDILKAREGEIFTYSWRFKINRDMGFSKRFTHMFQFKSFGGDAGAPIITITGRKSSEDGRLEVIHNGSPSVGHLAKISLTGLKGVWLEVFCRATFSHQGTLFLTIKTIDGKEVLTLDQKNIDMWRNGDHIRPKWGIYRGKSDELRSQEETVCFSNFAITPPRRSSVEIHTPK